jgi:hypothetical protein
MAFTPCTNLLAQSLATPCDEPRIKGYEAIGLIINRADIDWATVAVDAINPRIVTALPLKTTKKAAVIYNSKKNPLPFDGTQTTYNRDADAYDKVVQYYFEGIGGAAGKSVEALKDGDYIVILERKSKYATGSFQMFGYQKGLSAGNEGGAMVQDEATGYWLITMTTQEPWAEIEFNAGTYALSKTAFDALVTGAM